MKRLTSIKRSSLISAVNKVHLLLLLFIYYYYSFIYFGHKEGRDLQYDGVMDPGKSLVCSTGGGTFMPERL